MTVLLISPVWPLERVTIIAQISMSFTIFPLFMTNVVYTHICLLTLVANFANNIIGIHHKCEGGIEKSVPRITDWHHEACRVMTNIDREGLFFYSTLTWIMVCLFVWFDSLHSINNLSVIKGRVFLGWTSTKLGLMFLLKETTQRHRWGSKPAALRPWVKHSNE